MTQTSTSPTDGRRQRTERSRKAIIDAAISLVNAGVLIPTAQQVVDHAGVGLRTFFRHFEDMSVLIEAVDESIRDDYTSLLLGGDRQGSLDERIQHAIEQHAQLYERNSNIILTTTAQSWKYPFLKKNYARLQRGLRHDLDDWIPELKSLPKGKREAVDAIASFEMWHRLCEHQKVKRGDSIQIIVDMIKAIV